MAKNKKKCVACLGTTENYVSEKIKHKDGREGLVHCNWTCRAKARKAGWIV